MNDDPRIHELLERILDENVTPEEVCADFPELLPAVRLRLAELKAVERQLNQFFPGQNQGLMDTPPTVSLPRIEGYEVQEILGRGGMGVVYRARQLKLNRTVALKMMLSGSLAGRDERTRFQREAEAVAALKHPNIVQIHDSGELDGRQYFTMEYVDGGSLAQFLAGTPQSARQSAALVQTLARAVQVAHQNGIVHRDLKPSNVLLTADHTPKITDFGLAWRFESDEHLTFTGARVGTPSYMAPEQATGRTSAIGPATDVYALGAILYEMLTGRAPFRGESLIETERQAINDDPVPPSQLNSKVPGDLETICVKCLEKDPGRRYATAAELADDLQRFERGETILGRRTGLIQRLVKWINRHRALSAFLVSGLLLLNVSIGITVWALLTRSMLVQSVEDDIRETVELEQKNAWGQARIALERAKARLGNGGPTNLQQRIVQLEHELTFVSEVEQIRERRQRLAWLNSTDKQIAADYEQAFRNAELLSGEDNPDAVAARIRSSAVANQALVALDDWRITEANDSRKRTWLIDVAQLVDQNPVTRKLRDPGLWDDKVALGECLRSVPIENQSVHALLLAGTRLSQLHGDGVPFLKRVQQKYPNDYWANCSLAEALYSQNAAESVRYLQAAIALRPESHNARCYLSGSLAASNHIEEGLEEARIALQSAPTVAVYQFQVGLLLCHLGRVEEGMPYMLRACEMDPHQADWYARIGVALAIQNRHEESIGLYRKAISLDSNSWFAHQKLRDSLQALQRWDDMKTVWRELLNLNPPTLNLWDGYAEFCLYLRDEAEYRRIRTELLDRFGDVTDPRIAERTGRACLLLPASDEELFRTSKLIDLAMSVDPTKNGWLIPYFRFAKALAEYRAGHFHNARSLLPEDTLKVLVPGPRLLLAMVQHRLGQTNEARETLTAAIAAFNWETKNATSREAWIYHVLRREAEALLTLNQ